MINPANAEKWSFNGNVGQKTREFLDSSPIGLVIDGESTASTEGGIDALTYPATGEYITQVYCGGTEDARRAIVAARRAFDHGDWPRFTPRARGRVLEALSALVEQDKDLFAEVETLETGKPIMESRGDVARAIDGLRFYAAAAQMCRGETIDISSEFHSYTVKEPLGVVAAIVPWNVPLVLTVSKAAPALAVGNCLVVKPSPQTPLTALLLAQRALAAGMPPGALNVVTGGGSIGALLARDPEVDGITFTGSTETGALVAADAAVSHKRAQLELGGKSPNVVFADADLDEAIVEAASAIFYGQGEICSAGSRLLVERPVFDAVTEGVARIAERLPAGDPLDPQTKLGSLISRDHLQKVLGRIETGRKEGASVLTGGRELRLQGFEGGAFMTPTVLTDVGPDASVVQEEIFGPVLVALPFDHDDEALALANDTRYGLAAGVWTADSKRARRIASALRSGVVWINSYNQFDCAMPFGGTKASGGGSREWSHLALESFTETKSVWEKA